MHESDFQYMVKSLLRDIVGEGPSPSMRAVLLAKSSEGTKVQKSSNIPVLVVSHGSTCTAHTIDQDSDYVGYPVNTRKAYILTWDPLVAAIALFVISTSMWLESRGTTRTLAAERAEDAAMYKNMIAQQKKASISAEEYINDLKNDLSLKDLEISRLTRKVHELEALLQKQPDDLKKVPRRDLREENEPIEPNEPQATYVGSLKLQPPKTNDLTGRINQYDIINEFLSKKRLDLVRCEFGKTTEVSVKLSISTDGHVQSVDISGFPNLYPGIECLKETIYKWKYNETNEEINLVIRMVLTSEGLRRAKKKKRDSVGYMKVNRVPVLVRSDILALAEGKDEILACGKYGKSAVSVRARVSPSGRVQELEVDAFYGELSECVKNFMESRVFPKTIAGGSFSYDFVIFERHGKLKYRISNLEIWDEVP